MEQQLQELMHEFTDTVSQTQESKIIIDNAIQITKEELNNLCSYTSKTIRDKKFEVDVFLSKINQLKKDLVQIEQDIPFENSSKQNEEKQPATQNNNNNNILIGNPVTSYWNAEEYQSVVEVATKLQQHSEERLKEIMQILDELKQWKPQ